MRSAQDKQKLHFDVNVQQPTLDPGDLALLLLPTDNNTLLMHWKGSYRVLERVGFNDYKVQIADSTKQFHINLLNKFNELSVLSMTSYRYIYIYIYIIIIYIWMF